MKKFILGSAILVAASSAMAAPNTGTVNFIGAVSSATCDISLKNSAGGDISSVDLGVLSSTSTTNGTPVAFKLIPQDPTCLAKANANVTWTSPTLSPTGIANSTANGTNAYMLFTATNSNNRGNNAVLKEGQTSFDYTYTGGVKSFDYSAALAKPAGALTAGKFTASASYLVTYK